MEHDVALLGRAGLEVGQPLPGAQVPGARNAGLGHRRAQVVRGGVLPLRAEDAVYPAVRVPHHPHVVDIRVGLVRLGHHDRLVPEAEAADAVRAFRHRKERLPIPPFDPAQQTDLAVQLDRARIEDAVDSLPLHEAGVGLRVEVVPPVEGGVLAGEHRVAIAGIDAIIVGGHRLVRPGHQGVVRTGEPLNAAVE